MQVASNSTVVEVQQQKEKQWRCVHCGSFELEVWMEGATIAGAIEESSEFPRPSEIAYEIDKGYVTVILCGGCGGEETEIVLTDYIPPEEVSKETLSYLWAEQGLLNQGAEVPPKNQLNQQEVAALAAWHEAIRELPRHPSEEDIQDRRRSEVAGRSLTLLEYAKDHSGVTVELKDGKLVLQTLEGSRIEGFEPVEL